MVAEGQESNPRETVTRLVVFKTAALDRSATPFKRTTVP